MCKSTVPLSRPNAAVTCSLPWLRARTLLSRWPGSQLWVTVPTLRGYHASACLQLSSQFAWFQPSLHLRSLSIYSNTFGMKLSE